MFVGVTGLDFQSKYIWSEDFKHSSLYIIDYLLFLGYGNWKRKNWKFIYSITYY